MELRVLSLYPEQMNIYADRGNILFLRRRCEWRGIDFRWDGAGPGEAVDPGAHDLFYIGGGQDRDQRVVAADMVETKRAALASAVDDGAALLAVCGGYQLLGESYQLGEETLPGLGLADLRTVREPGPRLIGNVAIETDLGGEKRLPRASRTTAGAPTWAPAPAPSAGSSKGTATATTAATASRASGATTSSAPTSTVPCSPRTPGWPTT
jgi:CobQ-like glutamine amidotransferase family enzyme